MEGKSQTFERKQTGKVCLRRENTISAKLFRTCILITLNRIIAKEKIDRETNFSLYNNNT